MSLVIQKFGSDNIVITTNTHDYDIANDFVNEHIGFFDEARNIIKNIDNWEDYAMKTYGTIPKIFLFLIGGITNLYENINKLSAHLNIVILIDDIHQSKLIRIPRLKVLAKTRICLYHYGYCLSLYNYPITENTYWFPHSSRWIIDFNENPINKILVSGRASGVYPDRLYMYNLSLSNSNVVVLRCNHRYKINKTNENAICGKKFYEELNKYLACFVDSPRNYILAKVFEICSSGALLLFMGQQLTKEMETLGFKDNVNFIMCTRENVIQKINYIIDPKNRKDIDIMRKNGQELIKTKHTYLQRKQSLLELFNETYKEKNYESSFGTKCKLAF